MKLVVVESPSKARTIQKFLGPRYQVLSSLGHIRDLPKGEMGIDIEHDFKPKYVIPAQKRKIITQLKKAAQKVNLIYFATDEDREGESIAWHLNQILDFKETKRIVFHEITREAIEEALKNPRNIDIQLVNAQQARRILDRLVGYELSPFLWRKLAKGLSAGRVQSPTVRLIVEREREIEAFKPQEYWSIEAELKKQETASKTFIAKLHKIDNKVLDKLAIKSEKGANEIIKNLEGANYKVEDIQKKEIKKTPPPPFITSTLQQEANKRLGFTAHRTMRAAQELYEGVDIGEKEPTGLISYMRTDSVFLSDKFLQDSQKFIHQNLGKNYAPDSPRKFKTKSKLAQEAHEAIRPTKASRQPEEVEKYLSNDQYKLYDLIWRRALASQMSQAEITSTTVDITTTYNLHDPQVGTPTYQFRATGSVIKFDGFLKIWPTETKENILPSLAVGEKLELEKLTPLQHFTQPPARYSEASLIKSLEELGIGRPSTYVPIINTIQQRNYVAKEQKKFRPTEVGIMVNDLLVKHFSNIVDYQFTAQLEDNLDKIAQGKLEKNDMLKEFYEPFKKNLADKETELSKKELTEEKTDQVCEKCGRPMIIKMGRYGKFLACSGFPECKNTKPLPRAGTGVKCPKCKQGEIIEKKTRKGKTFYACNRWPKCDFALWQKPTGEKCPECDSLLVETARGVKCSNKKCKYKS